jgi:hypothetical protein
MMMPASCLPAGSRQRIYNPASREGLTPCTSFSAVLLVRYLMAGLYSVDQNERVVKNCSGARCIPRSNTSPRAPARAHDPAPPEVRTAAHNER